MISRKNFINAIESLKEYTEYEDRLYELSDGSIFLGSNPHHSRLVDSLVNLLCDGINEGDAETIKYWLWDLEFGTKYTEGCVTVDGVNIDISTVEKLYDFVLSSLTNE
jgi:hypothetical protein